MVAEIVGRERELGEVDAFLAHPSRGVRALVLEGPPGIGKSTVWHGAVDAARARSFTVLTSRPAEAEQPLPHLVLGDLFADVPAGLLATMPIPRRRAFEAAVLRADPEQAIDPRALGVAITGVLAALGAERPVVIAIDDDQWVDAASAATLRFALRRQGDSRVLLILARRTEGRVGSPPKEPLERSSDLEATHVRIGPLTVGALQVVLRQHLDLTIPRPALLRLYEESGGNAFHALELARARAASGSATDPEVRPPADLAALVAGRLAALDEHTREAVLLVAANGRTPVATLDALDVSAAAVNSAIAAGLLVKRDEIVHFSHPLLASAVYGESPASDRATAHRRLAEGAADPFRSIRHLALAASEPDPDLAARLESTARVAFDRGIPLMAADLAEHAARLTPSGQDDARDGRSVLAARARAAAGEGGPARSIAEDVLTRSTVPRLRVEALTILAGGERPGDALELLEQARAEAVGDPWLEAITRVRLAELGRLVNGDVWAEDQAAIAVAMAERLGDPALEAAGLALLALLRFTRGDPKAIDLARRALDLARQGGDVVAVKEATSAIAHILAWSAELDAAGSWLREQLVEWQDRDENMRFDLLWYLALVELWAGRWIEAREHAMEVVAIGTAYGLQDPQMLMPMALLELHQGNLEAARALSTRALELAPEEQLPTHRAVLGTCEAWEGAFEPAAAQFADAELAADARGFLEPALRWWRGEYVEALVRLGRLDAATRLVDDLETLVGRAGRARLLGPVLWCRGVVAGADGRLAEAADLLTGAVEQFAATGEPFAEARARLALGSTRRRAREKRGARQAIEAALAGFEQLGAASWAAAARTELGRIGGRVRTEGLSASELRVAELIAAGYTNREIAAALFVGERTVASHLTHIYSKLGMRSRTELARVMLTGKVPTS